MWLKKSYLAAGLAAAAVAVALNLGGAVQPAQAAAGTHLYLVPASQTVGSGANVVINVVVNTGGASVNTVQSVLTFSPEHFSFVSAVPGTDFSGAFPNSHTNGSVTFAGGSLKPVSGTQTVATVTLHSTGVGSSAVTLAGVCPLRDYAPTCSAAYDAANSNNDLASVTGGSFTANGAAAGGTGQSAPSPSPAVTATTTTVNPAPEISNVQVGDIAANSAVVTWDTNIDATSVVEFGLTDSYGQTVSASGLTKNHSVKLTSDYIYQGTTYFVQVLSATATGASATGGAQQFSTSGFDVTINVVDSKGKAIKGAAVTVGGETQTSDSNGVAKFNNVPGGSETVTIKSGDKTTTGTITVGKLDPNTGTYQLQNFKLTAVRGSTGISGAMLLVIVVAAIVILALLLALLRRLFRRGKGGGTTPAGGAGGGTPAMVPQVFAPESQAVPGKSPAPQVFMPDKPVAAHVEPPKPPRPEPKKH